MTKTRPSMVSTVLVALQVGLMAYLVIGTRPTQERPVSAVIILCGIALGVASILTMGPARVSPWPEPAIQARLVTRGPYARIRHPMYASLLLAGVGMAAHTISLSRAIALLALVPVLCAKMAIEEQAMRARFPEYAAYEKRTRRILPFLF